MKTLQDELDRTDDLMNMSEKDRGSDPMRNQELSNLLEQYDALGRICKGAREAGILLNDATPLFNIPRVTRGTTNVAHYYSKKVQWYCRKGHYFFRSLDDMENLLVSNLEACRACARVVAQGASTLAMGSRIRLVMQHDERGEDIHMEDYENVHQTHNYISRTNGISYVGRPKNIGLWGRPWDKSRKEVWIVEDSEYAFLWTGTRPIVKNPLIKALFETADAVIEPFYDEDVRFKKGYTYKSGLERAILECVEGGAKVLNLSLNPQYVSPGVYTWGDMRTNNAALNQWITSIENDWLDATTGE